MWGIDIAPGTIIFPWMNSLPSRRWNPGFIALRWRHLFWSLPLLGLLAGLVVHFMPMIRNTATGIVQPTRSPSDVSGRPPFAPSDVVQALESDKVLWSTIMNLDLCRRWKMEGEACVRKLRSSITCNPIHFRSNAMVEISVSGRSREESESIWHVLVAELKNHFNEARPLHDQVLLDLLERVVENQKADVESKRTALTEALQVQMSYSRHDVRVPITSIEVDTLKNEFEKSHASLQSLQIEFISKKSLVRAGYMDDALWLARAPGDSVPITLLETLRPLVLHSSFGLGSGMVVAVVLAYLLELLFRRKSPTL